jgi:translation initiation factor 2 subunit 2
VTRSVRLAVPQQPNLPLACFLTDTPVPSSPTRCTPPSTLHNQVDISAIVGDLTGKKKKKKKVRAPGDDFGEGGADDDGGLGTSGADGAGGGGGGGGAGGGNPWDGTNRDYTYEELLDRVFGILKAHNPALTGERRRTLLKPPQVAREGTKKTVFTNFAELCRAMNRPHEHVQAFLLAELGTSGNLDGDLERLIVKGRFLPKAFEGVLRRYANEYVLCGSCKAADTLLDRDAGTRVTSLRCQQCGSSRSVAAIKAGFVARTTRRPKVG